MDENWDRTLSLPNLPKKLTSRRNLHAYFSKFGEITDLSVNKDNRTALIEFATHAEAKTAVCLGKVYEGKLLRIKWFENTKEVTETKLDPRAREQKDVIDIENLWEDDDKECFGVETKPHIVDEIKKSAKDMISQHLNLPNVKKRLVLKPSAMKKSEEAESKVSSVKLIKSQPKVGLAKKGLASKRKLSRKEVITADKNKKKTSSVSELSQPANLSLEQDESKHKLSLLKERDKLIRQKIVQDSNIKTAVAIKGTCPDMCPERERIQRQVGHQVAAYESFPGTYDMDENKAVKEYSRSSADQEEPLPHDLRPGPVLSMTMSYLITNIISKIDDPNENKAVWYSFCWNRLRSIRKDIVLQQLCDLETVTIIEQCARFHISCYDHMWGNDVNGYDDKINTKNLIDCLQSLKHLYEDLAKHNIKCPNEPEFYSYMILVKLASGDVFWEFQQCKPEIQHSPKVQFAIEVYMAFLNNMYSKFFNLVNQASYLEACLLQRHFDEVRTRALKTMLKAYSLPNRSVSLTTSFLMKCLKFDSKTNVIRFCYEGNLDKRLDFDEDENEDEYVLTSSFLIRDKRLPIANAVVGENNPLPIYTPHQVHSSFDEDGKLREPLHTFPDENYDSYDSPLDDSVVSTPEERPQFLSDSKPFKFSLSPKVLEGNIFSQNVFSRLGPFSTREDNLFKKELSEIKSTEQKSSKIKMGSEDNFEADDSFYQQQNRELIGMEEDIIDEDMIYNEDIDEKDQETTSEETQLFSVVDSDERTHFTFQQSFPHTPTVTQMPTNLSNDFLQEKDNQSKKSVSSDSTPKHNQAMFQFSLAPKINSPKRLLFENSTNNKSPFERMAHCQPVDSYIASNNNKENHTLISKTEIKSNVIVEIKESPTPVCKEYQVKSQEKDMESVKREKEILEKLFLQKAEEERVRNEELKKAEIERQKKLIKQIALEKLRKDLSARMKARNARKYFRTWKARVEKLKKKRADFPFLHQLSVESHVELWGRMKYIPSTSVFQRAKDKQYLNAIVSQLLTNGVNDNCNYIGHDLAELLAKSAARTMDMGSVRPVYWKLAMSLPWKDRSTPKYYVFNNMMKRCCKQTFYKRGDAQLGSVESVMTSLQIPVHVSVHLSDDLQSCNTLQGMDALIFVVVDEFESEKTCLDRLRSLVTIQGRSSELSVAVMTINGNKFDRILKMELEELHEQNLVASWTVRAWTSSYCLIENLSFLTKNVNVVQDVCARSLESLVREAVDDFIYDVDRSQVYCPSLTDALRSPNTALNLYNTFLTKLEDLLLSSKLEKYFNFAEEFKSHIPSSDCGGPELLCGKQYNNQYKTQISNKINSLKLPELEGWPVHTDQIDFDSLADLLEEYCRTQIDDMEVFKQVIRKLAQEVGDPSSYLNSYSWLHIVELWAESRLNCVFSNKERNRKMFVIYSKNDLQRMIKKQWWITLPIVAQTSKKV